MNIQKIAILGAGTMGSGIAQVCAVAGLNVSMIDVSAESVERGTAAVAWSLERLVKKGRLSKDEMNAAVGRVNGTVSHDTLASADLVLEAATESLDLKLKLLQQIGSIAPASSVIASNTSSISITQLAAVVSHPGRLIGMHFFNPVPLMELVELIRGLQTTDATHARAIDFAKAIGKTPITARNSPGFAVNRVLVPMINEAIFVLQEQLSTAEDIDLGMKLGCNHPIGPLALADLIGLDTLLSVMQVFYEGFNDPKYRPAPLLKEMVAAGRLGRKTGHGFYVYP